DGAPWYEPNSAIDDADPAAAMALLEEAGWVAGSDGVRERDGLRAEFRLVYGAGDSVRQGLALAVADQASEVGIEITPEAGTWEEIASRLHEDAALFGWGSHDPTEMYNLYSSRYAGVEYWNPGFYENEVVDGHLEAALASTDYEESLQHWRAAQLDEDGEGFTASADAAWAWLVNLDHTYYVHECLDLGAVQTEPHGHGWPITSGIAHWSWTC
nr:ABC transporter substrate-binding protein [Actinomycetales bacterium]